MTVTGGRTVYELRGISCLPLELMEPTRKGIAVTRSFGAPVTSWQPMREAIASYATRAAEKMRRYKVAAENISVFMHTSTFNNDPSYSNGASALFAATTNDTGEVVAVAVRLGERLWRDGFRYSKCGVMITELLPRPSGNRPMGRAGPGSQGTSLESHGQAQCHPRARHRPHPRCRAEGCRLEAQGRVPLAAMDYAVG